MTAAVLTAAAAAEDLIGDLRRLLDRHEGASTLDDVRELADELSGMLGRTRGRIRRLARQAGPADKPAEQPETEPAAGPAKAPPSRVDPELVGNAEGDKRALRHDKRAAERVARQAAEAAPKLARAETATISLRRMATPAARAIRDRTSGDRKNPAPSPRPSPSAAVTPPRPRPHRRQGVTMLIILVAAWMLGAEIVALAGEGLMRGMRALERTRTCLLETWRSSRCGAIVSSLRRGRRP